MPPRSATAPVAGQLRLPKTDAEKPEGGWELTPESAEWPELVPREADICDVIYGMGDPKVLSEACISIIGARRGTPYGLAVAELAGRVAAECGLVVVSGGALGCDARAARAALAAGGKTIVVSGRGAEGYYPRSSKDVFDAARQRGAVVALAPWGSVPQPWAFPVRNRLIAALSKALIVCEAKLPSGTFSTAECAMELGRRIYAAPGSIFSPYTRGTNWLIEQGATPIVDDESLEMVISSDYDASRLLKERAEGERGAVLTSLIANPQRADELARSLNQDVITLLRTLGDYEADGLVTLLDDGCYAPTEKTLLALDGQKSEKKRKEG